MRGAMHFKTIHSGPYTIQTMHGDEPGYSGSLLVSIAGPGLPKVRLTKEGPSPFDPEMDEPLPAGGLVVFGRHKGDRPRLPEIAHCPNHGVKLTCPACLGAMTSEAKASAARANGRLGGRPNMRQ
jgi:hypothetical protein